MTPFDTYVKRLKELSQVDAPVNVEIEAAQRVHDEACRAAATAVPSAQALREQAIVKVDRVLQSSREILDVLDMAAIIPKKRRPALVEGADAAALRAVEQRVDMDVAALRKAVAEVQAARKRREEASRVARAAELEQQKLEREAAERKRREDAERKRLEDAEAHRLAEVAAARRKRIMLAIAVVGVALLMVVGALIVVS